VCVGPRLRSRSLQHGHSPESLSPASSCLRAASLAHRGSLIIRPGASRRIYRVPVRQAASLMPSTGRPAHGCGLLRLVAQSQGRSTGRDRLVEHTELLGDPIPVGGEG
jgi:hypothetical protein